MYLSDFWSGWIGAWQAVLGHVAEYRNDLRQADTLAAATGNAPSSLSMSSRRGLAALCRQRNVPHSSLPMMKSPWCMADGLDENEVLVTGVGHLLAIIALQPEVSYHVELGDGRAT